MNDLILRNKIKDFSMTTKMTKTVISSIIAIAVIGSLFGISEIIALDNDYQFDKSERPHADALAKLDEYEATNSDANFQKLSEIAVLDSDLKILGSEWELMSIATVSTTEPFEVTKLVAYLRLIDSPSNAQQCESNVEATIVYDAKTGEVLEKNIPLLGVCEKPLEIGKRTETTFLPEFIPQAFASSDRAFLTSEQGSPSGHHGGFGYTVPTPSYPNSSPDISDAYVCITENLLLGDVPAGDSTSYDFITLLIHETGHVAGLDHSTESGSVMVSGQAKNTYDHSLSLGDQLDLQGAY